MRLVGVFLEIVVPPLVPSTGLEVPPAAPRENDGNVASLVPPSLAEIARPNHDRVVEHRAGALWNRLERLDDVRELCGVPPVDLDVGVVLGSAGISMGEHMVSGIRDPEVEEVVPSVGHLVRDV